MEKRELFSLLAFVIFNSQVVDVSAAKNTESSKTGETAELRNYNVTLGGAEYFVQIEHYADWIQASKECMWRGMKLVSLDDEIKDILVVTHLNTLINLPTWAAFWTSGKNVMRTYLWTGTGYLMSLNMGWQPGKPSYPNYPLYPHGLCVLSKHGKQPLESMQDDLCSVNQFYVCEY